MMDGCYNFFSENLPIHTSAGLFDKNKTLFETTADAFVKIVSVWSRSLSDKTDALYANIVCSK